MFWHFVVKSGSVVGQRPGICRTGIAYEPNCSTFPKKKRQYKDTKYPRPREGAASNPELSAAATGAAAESHRHAAASPKSPEPLSNLELLLARIDFASLSTEGLGFRVSV